MFKAIDSYFSTRFKALKMLLAEYRLLVRHLGSGNCYKSQEKLRALIIMQAHIMEKGLALREVRPGFGVPKVLKLLSNLDLYYTRYKDGELLFFVLSMIEEYIRFNREKGIENSEIISKYKHLNSIPLSKEYEYLRGGTTTVTNKDIQDKCAVNYLDFVKSRYSIRNFTGEQVDRQLVYKALEIARYTPSACNRQPWGNHVFFNKEKIQEILDYQTGAKQFGDDLTCLILITSRYGSFFNAEYHQPYVNGGMYAMNLLLALHSTGLGTVSLNLGFKQKKLNQLTRLCAMQESEVPIMLIGVGVIPEELKVASSKRFKYEEYTTFYN